jgi:hypothetical protein
VPRGSRSVTHAVRPRSGVRLASAGTRMRQGKTPPAEVNPRYICALTGRYAGWASQLEQGRTRRGGAGVGGCGQPADRATWPRSGAGRRQDGRMANDAGARPPAGNGHTVPGAGSRGSTRRQRGRRSTRKSGLTVRVEPEHAAGVARPWPSVESPTMRNGPHSREFAASGPFSQVMAGVVSRFRTSRTGCLTALSLQLDRPGRPEPWLPAALPPWTAGVGRADVTTAA